MRGVILAEALQTLPSRKAAAVAHIYCSRPSFYSHGRSPNLIPRVVKLKVPEFHACIADAVAQTNGPSMRKIVSDPRRTHGQSLALQTVPPRSSASVLAGKAFDRTSQVSQPAVFITRD
jgi:hypothetical protein